MKRNTEGKKQEETKSGKVILPEKSHMVERKVYMYKERLGAGGARVGGRGYFSIRIPPPKNFISLLPVLLNA